MHPTGRPSAVTGAVTSAYVSAGVIGAGCALALAEVAGGLAGIQSRLFLLTLPGLVGLVVGARRLRQRSRRSLLVLSAMWTGAVLVVTSAVGLASYSDSAFVAFAAAPLLLVPLPVVAAALAQSSDVGDWLAGRL